MSKLNEFIKHCKEPMLQKHAAYTVNIKALKRWADERLRLTHLENGNIEAKFSYEGTTCSNFGHPLVYEYVVRLSPSAQEYNIEKMECAAAPGDEGHKRMCEYIKNAATLMHQIEQEKPMLGKSLVEVVGYSWPSMPEGCYCKQESRMHKWGLVLQTIHFALAHRTELPQ